MKNNLNDWSVTELLDLYKRIEQHVTPNTEPVFFLDYDDEYGWCSNTNNDGDLLSFSTDEAQLIFLFTGREYLGEQMVIHLFSVSGHFRNAIKAKVDEAIPAAPPAKWYNYIKSFRTNWTPEDKDVPAKAKPNRGGQKFKAETVPFPKGNVNKHEDPPF